MTYKEVIEQLNQIKSNVYWSEEIEALDIAIHLVSQYIIKKWDPEDDY